MKKKSLTVICHNLNCGGTEKVLTNIIYYYSNKNIETTIITLGPAQIFPSLKISKKTKIIELNKNYSNNIFLKISNIFNWIYFINKYIRKNRESIFLSFLTTPTILTIISSINLKIDHYGSERANPKYIKLPLHWRFLRFITYRKMNGLIVQTEEIKKQFLSYLPKRKIKVIQNSVEKVKKLDEVQKTNKKKLKVLFIGRLEYQKGIDIVLDTIKEIYNSKKKDNYIFEIVGNGSLYKFVESSIRENNLSDFVTFIKGSKKPIKFIRSSDIVLHPSRYEGISNVVLEAMSYGKCVISTYQSSSEIISNNKDGILIRKITASEIIQCLESISNNQFLLKKISLNAFNKIQKNYSEEKIFELWNKTLNIF